MQLRFAPDVSSRGASRPADIIIAVRVASEALDSHAGLGLSLLSTLSTSSLFCSHQFFRRAQTRHIVPVSFDDSPNTPLQFGIRKVAAFHVSKYSQANTVAYAMCAASPAALRNRPCSDQSLS